ncbi:MAG: SoxR reducing system RseC family protein, partial [Clostridia bacterium]
MIKFGQVSKYNEKTGMATVVYVRPDACEKCGACGSESHKGSIELKAACKQGDWVRVELPDARFVQATTIAYAIPLCGFLIGLCAGYFATGGNELWAVLGSSGGLGLCVLGLMINEKRIAGKPEWTPRIVAVYP